MITASSSLVDVAFEVCSAMHADGFTVVMTGGSAATYYAPAAYQSVDIDFVITLHGDHGDSALRAIGYAPEHGQYYTHPDSPFPVEFPKGPLAVGDELIVAWATDHRRHQLLNVLTPTDSCRDRLSQFLAWHDFSALEQALAVAHAQRDRVDLDAVRAWCLRERALPKYELFATRLRGS